MWQMENSIVVYAHKDIAFSLSEFICAACINE